MPVSERIGSPIKRAEQALNAAKNALCAEVNYKEAGKYLGFRRAYVTADVIWVEPAEDHVSHRVFELNFKRMGCTQEAPPS